ncbi:fungal-specific transcription factor domain-containing protein [Peziza echinospora]|nr:fungal-specific transcription factor domain-containing protein [Peziza echinospora]
MHITHQNKSSFQHRHPYPHPAPPQHHTLDLGLRQQVPIVPSQRIPGRFMGDSSGVTGDCDVNTAKRAGVSGGRRASSASGGSEQSISPSVCPGTSSWPSEAGGGDGGWDEEQHSGDGYSSRNHFHYGHHEGNTNGTSTTSTSDSSRTTTPIPLKPTMAGPATASAAAAAELKAKRKRSMIACKNCNERRVRCDGSITGLPCTTCKGAGRTDCMFIDSKRVRGKRGRFESRDKEPNAKQLVPAFLPKSRYPPGASPGALSRNTAFAGSNIVASLFPPGGPSGGNSSGFHGYGGRREVGNVSAGSSDNNVWRRLFDGAAAGVPQTTRVTYIGESWHLSWVLHQKTGSSPLHFHSPVQDDSPEMPPGGLVAAAATSKRLAGNDSDVVNNSGPLDVRADAAATTRGGPSIELPIHPALPPAMYALKDAFTVPPPPIRDALIETYFDKFHPLFPLLSRPRFLSCLNSSFSLKEPSMLLLQSVLMIGAIHCPLSLLTSPHKDAPSWTPFSSRAAAAEVLVSRARTLFNNDVEKDRLSLVQSMFLMQFWWRVPKDFRDQCYWLAGAIRTAQGMGLHRSTQASWAKGVLDDQQRRTWRRTWWLIYVRDCQTAAAMGKPVMVRDDDCDVEELSIEDFEDEPLETGAFLLESIKLVRILRSVMACEFTPAASSTAPLQRAEGRKRFQAALEDWRQRLPEAFQHTEVDVRVAMDAQAATRRLMGLMLHMTMHGYELLLHRPIINSADNGTTHPEDAATKRLPAPVTSNAAKAITQLVREGLHIGGGDARIMPIQTVSFIFGALSVQIVELKSGDAELEASVRGAVTFNMSTLAKLAEMYPVAGWCRKLMQKILQESEDEASSGDTVGERPSSPTPTSASAPPRSSNEQYNASIGKIDEAAVATQGAKNNPPGASGHNLLQNSIPLYNAHAHYYNVNFNSLDSSVSPPAMPSAELSQIAPTSPPPITLPTPPVFNPFDLASIEEHSGRLRNLGIRYAHDSTSAGSRSSSEHPTRTHTPVLPVRPSNTNMALHTDEQMDPEVLGMAQKWASDNLLDENLLAKTGPLDATSSTLAGRATVSTTTRPLAIPAVTALQQHQQQELENLQRQRDLERLRYHAQQQLHNAQSHNTNVRVIEQAFDGEGDMSSSGSTHVGRIITEDSNEEDGDETEDELVDQDEHCAIVLQSAALAARRARETNANSGPQYGFTTMETVTNTTGASNHIVSGLGANQAYVDPAQTPQWLFDGSGMLIGNPFLAGVPSQTYPSGVRANVDGVRHGPANNSLRSGDNSNSNLQTQHSTQTQRQQPQAVYGHALPHQHPLSNPLLHNQHETTPIRHAHTHPRQQQQHQQQPAQGHGHSLSQHYPQPHPQYPPPSR